MGGGCLDIFPLFYHFSFLSPSLWDTAQYRLKYCLKGSLSPEPNVPEIHLFEIKVTSVFIIWMSPFVVFRGFWQILSGLLYFA